MTSAFSSESNLQKEADQLLADMALGPECRPAVMALLESYDPMDITTEHVEEMMRIV